MFHYGYRAIFQKDLRTAIDEAAHNGFEVLEIHLASPQFLVDRYSPAALKKIRSYATQRGVTLQTHAPFEVSLLFSDPVMREATKKFIKKVARFSTLIGARCMTVHPGFVVGYHDADGKKIKNDDLYRAFYKKLFDESMRFMSTLASSQLVIGIENTDNFNTDYRMILEKYLRSKKLFLTWDVRKNFSMKGGALNEDQWNYVQRNKKYVRNLHMSGLGGPHGAVSTADKRLMPFIGLFKNQDLPMIFEVEPLRAAITSKRTLVKMAR